ncbi:hypothetical protein AB4Y42_41935 [Paraburkholderia sp. EG286B]|uniref:hypothetical protein n=1 Tax=Paraburkholderia sp. EG286B TaxID=3237011 RepID=UPI0034D176C7
MKQSHDPASYAIAVYFNGGIPYCFDRAPKDMPSMEHVTRALDQVVWQRNGVAGVPIYGRRDGFLIFDFDKSPEFAHAPGGADVQAITALNQRNARCYQYANAFLMGLHSGLAATMKAGTPVQAPLNGLNWCRAVNQDGGWLITDNAAHPVEGSNFLAQDLTLDALDHAVDVVTRCTERFPDDGLKILELCLIAGNQYALHQFESAHLIAWTVIEKSLNKMWAELLHELNVANGGHTNMNRSAATCLRAVTIRRLS